jgi:hypothetical protein
MHDFRQIIILRSSLVVIETSEYYDSELKTISFFGIWIFQFLHSNGLGEPVNLKIQVA